MVLLKTILMAIIIPLIMPTSNSKPVEYTIKGMVTVKETGKPLPDIYLYTIKGEEEAMTNHKGEFKFISWQKLPLTLYVNYKEEANIRILVSNPSEYIKISL